MACVIGQQMIEKFFAHEPDGTAPPNVFEKER
jgi:hypothetical protein